MKVEEMFDQENEIRSQANRNKAGHTPEVSIGMPVYNGEKFIREALDSLLAQTFTDFELIISDNASTDGTEAICQEYAAKDMRIRYVRQAENKGPIANFQFVLDEAVGEYFMWAACDDRWGTNFISCNLKFLKKEKSCIAAITKCTTGYPENDPIKIGYAPIAGATFQKQVLNFIKYPGGNVRFYSLYRTEKIKKVNLAKFNFLGGDWAVIIEAMKYGKFCQSSDDALLFKRSGEGESSDIVRLADSQRTLLIELIFPYIRLTKYIIKIYGFRMDVAVLMFKYNYSYARQYWPLKLIRYIYPTFRR